MARAVKNKPTKIPYLTTRDMQELKKTMKKARAEAKKTAGQTPEFKQ